MFSDSSIISLPCHLLSSAILILRQGPVKSVLAFFNVVNRVLREGKNHKRNTYMAHLNMGQ
jgi:hypothetical protein